MRTDLWGSRNGILFVFFLLSKFEQRSLNAAASSCGRGYFRNVSLVDADIFYADKKDAFSKISEYAWTRLKVLKQNQHCVEVAIEDLNVSSKDLTFDFFNSNCLFLLLITDQTDSYIMISNFLEIRIVCY